MGEAGPEAVMPLKRGRDGKLGVAVTGGGTISVVNHFTLAQPADARTQAQIARQAGMGVARAMRRDG
jgi:phage-related minor tail protein